MTLASVPGLMDEVRSRFAHVETCPFSGPRVFFENAGGALTLTNTVDSDGGQICYIDSDDSTDFMLVAVAS